ncbi:MAG: RNA-guided endonuclease InsQ/TnpB family protein [Cetobacterium sp.]
MKSYKIEINPTKEQVSKIENTSNICRFIYNEMIATNELIYDMSKTIGSEKKFMGAMSFSLYVNNTLSKCSNMTWIKSANTKAVKQAMMNCEKAFKMFFKKEKGYPKYKKKKDFYGVYLPKNNKTDFEVKRHKIKIPMLSWIRVKEFGYLSPKNNIKSCTITKKADRYFISFLVDDKKVNINTTKTSGIGVDLGIKDLAISSNGKFFKNINKGKIVKKLEKKLKHKQKNLSRKFESLKLRKKEGVPVTKRNIEKNILSVQKINLRLSNIRTEYTRSVVNTLARTKPEYITIEDLSVKNMMKNRNLSKAIANQKWYYFRLFLIAQAKKQNIEIRVVSRTFPSSKTCNCCGTINKTLKLKDRVFKCDCGYAEDRDLNASYNLRDCKKYKIAT